MEPTFDHGTNVKTSPVNKDVSEEKIQKYAVKEFSDTTNHLEERTTLLVEMATDLEMILSSATHHPHHFTDK